MIVMVNTNPGGPRHAQHSQILVPFDTPGVVNLRPMQIFNIDDAPHGHMHMRFTDVRVPKENMILGEGRGFEVAQGRLGPGRIHHCMRSLGLAEAALKLMCERSLTREAFGRPLAKLGGNVDVIAQARIEIEMTRLLCLKAAWLMDHEGTDAAQPFISMIKVAAPNMALKIIDEAMQMHGGLGLSQDTPLAIWYGGQRTLRFADGPDSVHRMVIARRELSQYR
ncbi:MAG: acyl-CoA dehydrogenase family protein, partial [Porticoccaceae bacterium]